MVDGRATSRPRLCLSCATCRRRKVRCTKEQPACNSCVRTNEECRYDKHAWKKANAQAKQNKATNNHQNKDRVSKRPEISTQQEHWDDWIGQPFEPMQVQSNLNEDFITQPNLLEQRSHNPIPPSTPNSNQGDTINDNSNSVDITAPSVGDCCYSNGSQSGIFDDFSNISSWSSTNQDSLPASSTPLRRTISAPRPSSTVSNHQYNAFLPRAETPTDELPRACSLKNTLTQETHSSQNVLESSVGSAERQTSEGTTRNNQQPPGHFSVRSEAQVRYVSAAFWGYVKNCEPLCENLLRGPQRTSRDIQHPHINFVALTNLLSLLPSRSVCNTLLYCFLIGLRSVYPLIHIPSFRADYDDFWHGHSHSDTVFQSSKLANDPSFLCLLFSVLYCGAATTPSSFWAIGALQSVTKESTLDQLKHASSSSLKAVQHLCHPTFHSLVAMLLRHSCLEQEGDSSADSSFVSTAVRTAQSMGLHLEPSKLGFSVIECEMRRRVWWHILWLDLQNSIFTGLPLCFHRNDAHIKAPMVGETQDKNIGEPIPNRTVTPSTATSSASMLFSIGRFETARFERLLVVHLHDTEGPDSQDLIEIENAYANLQLQLDNLISRMPAKGIPEKGLIPSRLANASPLSQRELYADHLHAATVFTSWARIMLTMSKTEATILFQRVFMEGGKAKTERDQGRWNSIHNLCIAYLRNFLQIMQTPAFAPYVWFNFNYYGPLQAVFLILVYVQSNHDPESEPQALYLVDEVIDCFVSEEGSSAPSHFTTQFHLSWTVIKSLRLGLPSRPPSSQAQAGQQHPKTPFAEFSLNPLFLTASSKSASTAPLGHISLPQPRPHTRPSNTPILSANIQTEPNHFIATSSKAISPPFTLSQSSHGNYSGVDDDMDIMDDYSDLDAWSDSLVQAAEDNLSSTRAGRSGEPDVLLGTPLSRARTPISVAGRRAGILPSKIPWGHDLDARRGEMGGSPVGTAKPRDGGGRDVDRNGNGGERSGSHVLRNGGSMSADTMTGDNIWMDL